MTNWEDYLKFGTQQEINTFIEKITAIKLG